MGTGGFVNDANTFSFATVYPGGFTPRFIGVVDQAYGTLGFKGKADSGFTYDISASLSRNSLDLSMTNSLSASFGPQSQTSFKFGKLIQGETVLNADFTYPLEVGFDSPITLSAGGEYRRERYEKTVGDLQSYAAGPFASQVLYNLVTPAVGATPAVYTAAGTTVTQSPAARRRPVSTCPRTSCRAPESSRSRATTRSPFGPSCRRTSSACSYPRAGGIGRCRGRS